MNLNFPSCSRESNSSGFHTTCLISDGGVTHHKITRLRQDWVVRALICCKINQDEKEDEMRDTVCDLIETTGRKTIWSPNTVRAWLGLARVWTLTEVRVRFTTLDRVVLFHTLETQIITFFSIRWRKQQKHLLIKCSPVKHQLMGQCWCKQSCHYTV